MQRLREWWAARRSAAARRKALVEGVEAIVDRVDPRLRGLSSYRSRLVPALESAVRAVDALIESMPPASSVSPDDWSSSSQLRAFFTHPKKMQEVFDTDRNIRDFLTSAESRGAEVIYGAMSMRMEKSTRFGSEEIDGQVYADQQQQTFTFSDYRIGVLATDEASFRSGLRRRVLEEVAARAMQQILGLRTRRDMLVEEKDVLKWKLKIFEMRKAGIGALLHDQSAYDRHIDALQAKLGSVSMNLQDLLERAGTLEDFLDITVEAFETVSETVRLDSVGINVNHMNIETTPERGGRYLELVELRFGKRRPRIVTLIRFSPDFPTVDTDRALRRAARALGVHQ